jgi:hypothetical protein
MRRTLLCLSLLLPCAAHADAIGQEQADALQHQLRNWITSIVGPTVNVPELPLHITGAGDSYRLAWPLPSDKGDTAVTASLRPLDGGKWAIDNLAFPSEASFNIPVSNAAADAGAPTKVSMRVGSQDSHAVIDPAFAAASTLQFQLSDLFILSEGAKQRQEQKIGRYAVSGSLTPAADGRLDLDLQGTMQAWASAGHAEGGTTVLLSADSLRATARIDDINRDSTAGLVAATVGLVTAMPADVVAKGKDAELPEAARIQLRKLIEATNNLSSALRLTEEIDGLKVDIAGKAGIGLQHASLGIGGESKDGRLHAWIDLGADGIQTPTLPPELTAYLPQHVALRPSVSGITTTDLRAIALDATGDKKDDKIAQDMAAIYAHGGVDVGLDKLAFDLGPAKLAGTGHVTAKAPNVWSGEAHVTCQGLDELIDQVRDKPELQQALPILIMLRGLARTDGDHLVWDVEAHDGTFIVNGTDLSQLLGKKPAHPKTR